MKACATASGGVMFIPEKIERKITVIAAATSNDNADVTEAEA